MHTIQSYNILTANTTVINQSAAWTNDNILVPSTEALIPSVTESSSNDVTIANTEQDPISIPRCLLFICLFATCL